MGTPLREALIFVHNALTGFGLRKQIKSSAAARSSTGFDVVSRLAIGADVCNSARAMMLALGCIQALRCNTNECPTGVATQDPAGRGPRRERQDAPRVANYHRETLKSVAELIGAMGIRHTSELSPWHLMKRTGMAEVSNYEELFDWLPEGSLLGNDLPPSFARAMKAASAEKFDPVNP